MGIIQYTRTWFRWANSYFVTLTNATWASRSLNVSYTYEPDGYVTSGAGRAVAGLIILFAAMGIAFASFPNKGDV